MGPAPGRPVGCALLGIAGMKRIVNRKKQRPRGLCSPFRTGVPIFDPTAVIVEVLKGAPAVLVAWLKHRRTGAPAPAQGRKMF